MMLVKALTETKGKKKINYIEGICSTADRDVQGESIVLEGIDLGYLNQRGGIFLNFEHQKALLIGVIQKAEVRKAGLWIKARLFNTAFALKCFEFAKEAEEAGTPMGFSIEAPPPIRDPEDKTIITKAKIVAVALTSVPVNGTTSATVSKSLADGLLKSIDAEKYSLDYCKEAGDKLNIDWGKVDLENFQKGMIKEDGDSEKVYKNIEADADYYSEKSISTSSAAALVPESLEKKKKELRKSIKSLHNSKINYNFTSDNISDLLSLRKSFNIDAPVAFVKKLKQFNKMNTKVNSDDIKKSLSNLGIEIEETVLEAPVAKAVEPAAPTVAPTVEMNEENFVALTKNVSDLTNVVKALVTKLDTPVVEAPAAKVEEAPVAKAVEAPAAKAVEAPAAKVEEAPVVKAVEPAAPTPVVDSNEAAMKSISALTNSVKEAFDGFDARMTKIENSGGVVKSVRTTGYVEKSFKDPNAAAAETNQRSLSNPSERREIIKSIESISGVNNVHAGGEGKIDESLMKSAMDLELNSNNMNIDIRTKQMLREHAGIEVVA